MKTALVRFKNFLLRHYPTVQKKIGLGLTIFSGYVFLSHFISRPLRGEATINFEEDFFYGIFFVVFFFSSKIESGIFKTLQTAAIIGGGVWTLTTNNLNHGTLMLIVGTVLALKYGFFRSPHGWRAWVFIGGYLGIYLSLDKGVYNEGFFSPFSWTLFLVTFFLTLWIILEDELKLAAEAEHKRADEAVTRAQKAEEEKKEMEAIAREAIESASELSKAIDKRRDDGI